LGEVFNEEEKVIEFLLESKTDFEEHLLTEAVNVREKIEEILLIGNVDLLNNAHKLVHFVMEQKDEEIITFAEKEGVLWAAHSLTLSFKLEWVQAIRRTLWNFLYMFVKEKNRIHDSSIFFDLEKKVNDKIDLFLKSFFISYSEFKDNLIQSQRNLVKNLSVPIIPITPTACILPLIGEIDEARMDIIEEKILMEIGSMGIQVLILDLSGIIEIEVEILRQFMNILDGTAMMGCKTVITGLRPEVVTKMVRAGVSFENRAETKGTLQQALKDYHVLT
jgi:rsbT co-antagonist protein RsbR